MPIIIHISSDITESCREYFFDKSEHCQENKSINLKLSKEIRSMFKECCKNSTEIKLPKGKYYLINNMDFDHTYDTSYKIKLISYKEINISQSIINLLDIRTFIIKISYSGYTYKDIPIYVYLVV